MKFMIFLMPVMLLITAWKSRGSGVVATFRKAGALSAATARKPTSVGTLHPDFVRKAARRGTLIDMGDGRYYVNLPRVEQRRKRTMMMLGGAAVLTVACGVWVAWELWG